MTSTTYSWFIDKKYACMADVFPEFTKSCLNFSNCSFWSTVSPSLRYEYPF